MNMDRFSGKSRRLFLILMLLLPLLGLSAEGKNDTPEPMEPDSDWAPLPIKEGQETAVFAGGCFWGVEAVYEALDGVLDVKSGYSGGPEEAAVYEVVGTGRTGHAEAVEIIYDPSVIDYATLLDVFFTVAHDPTQLNYQGPDRGPQYRSAVFYANLEQKTKVEAAIEKYNDMGLYKDSIVTQVNPLEAFYPAEEYHQDFMEENPNHPYILYWDAPKLEHLEEAYPELLKDM